jgi:hypothetical protein
MARMGFLDPNQADIGKGGAANLWHSAGICRVAKTMIKASISLFCNDMVYTADAC